MLCFAERFAKQELNDTFNVRNINHLQALEWMRKAALNEARCIFIEARKRQTAALQHRKPTLSTLRRTRSSLSFVQNMFYRSFALRCQLACKSFVSNVLGMPSGSSKKTIFSDCIPTCWEQHSAVSGVVRKVRPLYVMDVPAVFAFLTWLHCVNLVRFNID